MTEQRKGKAQNEEKSISGNIDSIKLHYVCGMWQCKEEFP